MDPKQFDSFDFRIAKQNAKQFQATFQAMTAPGVDVSKIWDEEIRPEVLAHPTLAGLKLVSDGVQKELTQRRVTATLRFEDAAAVAAAASPRVAAARPAQSAGISPEITQGLMDLLAGKIPGTTAPPPAALRAAPTPPAATPEPAADAPSPPAAAS